MKVFLRRAVLFLLALLPAMPAQAEQITFWIQSDHYNEVWLEFSSGDEPDRYWPGNGLYYPLRDYEARRFPLTCRTGELVCWGAWDAETGSRWGRGFRADTRCEDCCYQCVGQEVDLIVLQPG